eukprot:COSAG06_NODE_25688_length_631_cov_0.610902_2_plen_34_part_01
MRSSAKVNMESMHRIGLSSPQFRLAPHMPNLPLQ